MHDWFGSVGIEGGVQKWVDFAYMLSYLREGL